MKKETNMTDYTVVTWPDIQYYMSEPGFDDNSFLINDEEGIEKFGSSAYFVDTAWLKKIDKKLFLK